jgi:uncharacterized membrane protein
MVHLYEHEGISRRSGFAARTELGKQGSSAIFRVGRTNDQVPRDCYHQVNKWRMCLIKQSWKNSVTSVLLPGFLYIAQWLVKLWNALVVRTSLNPLNAELNTICHLLALLGAHHFLRISRIRVKRGRDRERERRKGSGSTSVGQPHEESLCSFFRWPVILLTTTGVCQWKKRFDFPAEENT